MPCVSELIFVSFCISCHSGLKGPLNIYIFYYSLPSVFGFYIATVAPCGEALSPHTQQLRQVLTFGVKALFSHFISQRNKGQSEARLQQNHCNKQYYPPAPGWGLFRKWGCLLCCAPHYVGRAYAGIDINLFRLLCQGCAQSLAKVRLAIYLLCSCPFSRGSAKALLCLGYYLWI